MRSGAAATSPRSRPRPHRAAPHGTVHDVRLARCDRHVHAVDYYPSEREYLTALAEAMFDEYRTIVEAGLHFTDRLPGPGDGAQHPLRAIERRGVPRRGAYAPRRAGSVLSGCRKQQVRLHLCWGNFEGPHNHDIPLRDIIEMVLAMPVGGISFEAANPRHAHEWTGVSKRLDSGGYAADSGGDRYVHQLHRAP